MCIEIEKSKFKTRYLRVCCRCKWAIGCTIYEDGGIIPWNCRLCMDECDFSDFGDYKDQTHGLCPECIDLLLLEDDKDCLEKVKKCTNRKNGDSK